MATGWRVGRKCVNEVSRDVEATAKLYQDAASRGWSVCASGGCRKGEGILRGDRNLIKGERLHEARHGEEL